MGNRTPLTAAALLTVVLAACTGSPGETDATTSTEPTRDDAASTSRAPDDPAATTTSGPPVAEPAEQQWQIVTQPMSAPVVEGSTVLYYAFVAEAMQLVAVGAADGEVRWRAPATMSSAVTGVGARVQVVDGQVVLLSPAEGGSSRLARLEVRDPESGDVVVRTDPQEFADLPERCAADEDRVCAQVYRGGPSVDVRLTDDGTLQDAPAEGLPGWQDIGSLGMARETGQHIGRVVHGELLWDLDLGEVIAQGASTNTGWTFQDVLDEEVIVASVGTRDAWSGDTVTIDVTDYAAFALDPADGTLVWKAESTDAFCDIAVPDREPADEPLLACQWKSGTVVAGDGVVEAEDLDVELVRLDPRSGETLWQLPLGDAEGQVDGWRPVVLPGTEGTAVVGTGEDALVVDLETGEASPAPQDLVTWDDGAGSVDVLTLGERRSVSRVGVVDPSTADGSDTVTWPLAGHVGAEVEVDGTELRVVSQDRSVTAYRSP
ncbi:PQQ-binding-like beta-propeller repeat protein [Serinicoccus marinus]|uniref:outer membrane protein assembly factor BamB family protein n=1 Tax=Serinicoccus marinus TaxID=247333 RepID=UPI00248FD101|nr:PQQ-binding-like beta-propeller repeat protein [Serinicoccus marinus]